MTRFAELQLVEPLLRAVKKQGYTTPTPIQAQAIPAVLRGRDLIGIAPTGTGKTAAYALPILQHIARTRQEQPRPVLALVLSPTRELALQVGRRFATYGRLLDIASLVLCGGVSEHPQVTALHRGVDVVVATPGRLRDLHRRGHVRLDRVDHVVLDEADRMLDRGFIGDIRKIIRVLPRRRQSMLFSATLSEPVQRLAAGFLRDPLTIEATPSAASAPAIAQQVMYLQRLNRLQLLTHLLGTLAPGRALVFTRTKRAADRLTTLLQRADVPTEAIHGDRSQAARFEALRGFREGRAKVLVATDVAARGLDIPGVDHVFNYDLPADPETYVHRIGRTGRAGRSGVAISFCDETSGGYLRDIERLTGVNLTPVFDQPWHSHDAVPDANATGRTAGGRRKKRHRRRRP